MDQRLGLRVGEAHGALAARAKVLGAALGLPEAPVGHRQLVVQGIRAGLPSQRLRVVLGGRAILPATGRQITEQIAYDRFLRQRDSQRLQLSLDRFELAESQADLGEADPSRRVFAR